MRNLVAVVITMSVMMSSSMVKASESFVVAVTDFSVINVTLSSISEGEQLYLKSYDGEILFNETLAEMPFYKKNFNLKEVSNGIYFVETQTESEIKVTPVVKNNKGISLIKNSAITIFKPQLKVADKVVAFSFHNMLNEPISITVLDKDWTVLNEEVNIKETVVKRSFNMEALPADTYYVYCTQNGRTFLEEFVIE